MPQNFIERLKQSPVLCDGAMGTLLYAKGIFINRCYDELNLSQPELIRGVHQDYLQAGAEIIETNTFGGNSFRLARHGMADASQSYSQFPGTAVPAALRGRSHCRIRPPRSGGAWKAGDGMFRRTADSIIF